MKIVKQASNFNLKFVSLIFSLLFLFQSTFAAEKASWLKKIKVLDNLQFVITPEEDHSALIAAFGSAKKSIKVGIFGISSRQIGEALSQAAQRGVEVTIICDKYCLSDDKRKNIFESLEKSGVKMVMASTGFSITHWKMFIIDEKRAFISTMNFITRTQQMRDFGIFTTEPSVVQEVLAVFHQDLENAKTQSTTTPLLSQPNLIWSPNNSEIKLTELINSAEKTIEIWIENMGNRTLHAALKMAVNRGVQVRVLTSQCGLGMDPTDAFSKLNDLSTAGIDVRGMPFPAGEGRPYIHAKSINVDHQTLFLGSENFSYNSLLKARELGIVLQDAQIQKVMTEYYEKDWAVAEKLPSAPPKNCSPMTPTETQ